MPFYEYECSACQFYVEALQKISEPPLRECPTCKKQTLTRLVSAPVFRLKGGGWYETDFKSDQEGKRNLAVREEPAETKPAEAKESKPEKESATKSEGKAEKAEPNKTIVSKPTARAASKPAKPAKPKAAKKPAPAKKKKARR